MYRPCQRKRAMSETDKFVPPLLHHNIYTRLYGCTYSRTSSSSTIIDYRQPSKYTCVPVLRFRQRGVAVLVEVGERRLCRLEESQALHTAVDFDAYHPVRVARSLATPKHEVWAALHKGVVVRPHLTGRVRCQYSVPGILFDHYPAPADQLRVGGEKVPDGTS